MVKNSTSIKPALLSGKGLLATFVGLLLTGQVLAETAGRVNFVVGEVSAISSDGSRRVLGRGDLVNSGERLETGKGRLQIRFTDGSFISLQPNTVFGLDNYAFNKAKPNEGTLLFNFIRGGMRTVSGAIGKVNRANYSVKTPVATIGIRGTSYAAEQQPNGRLLLTVSKGMVNISNDFGSGNVSVGQTFQTTKDKAPEAAPDGVSVSARADTPESNRETKKQIEDISSNEDDDKTPDTALGDQPSFEGFFQTTDGIPRLSSFGSLLKGTSGVSIYPNIIAVYDSLSLNGREVGNLIGLTGTDQTGGDTSGELILNTRNDLKSLNFANVKQFGSLSLGEWTDGTAASVDPYLHQGSLTLSKTQFIPYIVGVADEKNLGNNAKVSYVLAGNTPVRAGLQTGTLNKLNIDLDLNLIPLVSIDMGLTLDNVGYTAKLSDQPITLESISFEKTLTGFVFTGIADQFFAKSTDNSCINNQCPVNLSAFFSSSDLGVVYEIERLNKTTIGGVAALSGTESTITSTIPSATRLDSSLKGVYSALFSTNTQLATPTQTQLAAVFDSPTGKLLSTFHVSNTNGELAVTDIYAPIKTLSSNAASSSDVSHFDKVLSWGAWSNGSVILGLTPDPQDSTKLIRNTQVLAGNSNIHYLIGLPTAASAIPKTGSVTYSLVGGTTPQVLFGTLGANNNVISTADTGRLNANSTLAIDFATANASLNMGIDGLTKAGSLNSIRLVGSTSLSNADTNLNFNRLTVTTMSNGTALVNDMTGTATGGFFGTVNPIGTTGVSAPQAAGLVYNASGSVITGQTTTSVGVNGVSTFGNAVVTPAAGG